MTFSPKRAFGITRAKQRLSRVTGIPTTRAGRERKVGQFVMKLGFLPLIALIVLIFIALL